MLGYRTADFADNKKTFLQDLIHPDDQYAQPLSILADLDQVSHFAIEFRLRALNGDYNWILSRGEVVERNASGKPARIIGTFADITQRKDSEDCLRDNRQQLEERNKQVELLNAELTRRAVEAESAVRTKELFLANIGHELRTPLTPIIGFVDLLLNNITDPVQTDWLTSIKRSAHHLLQIINDMLDLTLIEAGRMKIDNLDFPLAALIDDLRNLTSGQLHEKRLAFELTIAPDVPSTLRGDPRRLLQILLNFVNNAIKFTERGTVALHIRSAPATGSRSDLRFEVSDTGIGIPSELHTRLFSKFVQGDDSFRRKNGGLGLGLSIAKQLAKLMNGEVGFESVVGKGSTFWFRGHFELPATENPARAVEGAPPEPAEPNAVETSLARLEALLANDDSESNRWFGKIESALLGTCDPVLLADLKTAITHFDYVSAVGLVRELRRQ